MHRHDEEKAPLLGAEGKQDINKRDAHLAIQQPPEEGRMFVMMLILVTELCERLTYYSIIANLVLFCTNKLHYSSPDASTVTLIFTGTCYIVPVFGGWIADSISGRFNAILGSGMIYVLGTFLLPAASVNYTNWFSPDEDGLAYDLGLGARQGFFILGLTLTAIGTGGIKANVGPFGAQQVESQGEKAVQSFFNWFYWFINIGSLIAYSGVAYIQQNVSFDYGYLVPFLSMIVALICFALGKSRYVHKAPGGSALSSSVMVVREAVSRRKINAGKTKTLLDNAKKEYGGSHSESFVEGVKVCIRIVPVFLCIIMYWAIYSQMQSTFFTQSVRMDIQVGGVTMPAALLNVFNIVIILIMIPIMDRVVYPLLTRYKMNPSLLKRMAFGMILAACAMFVAGVLEIYRKENLRETGGMIQDVGGEKYNASTMSMFYQVPQFALIGASEIFTSISGLEFAFSQAPVSMQGLIMGLFLLTSGLGSYVATAIIQIVNAATTEEPWFPNEINNGYTENLFFMLGGIMLVDFVVFIFVARFYKYAVKIKDDTSCEVTIKTVPDSVTVNKSPDKVVQYSKLKEAQDLYT